MVEVNIPFLEEFRKPMLDGTKRVTCRTKRMANKGDTFKKFGVTFIVEDVHHCSLGLVANFFWKKEGTTSPQEFVQVWNKNHPRKKYDPDQKVYIHFFLRTK